MTGEARTPQEGWLCRRWTCFLEGHDWLDLFAAQFGGANVCKRCGKSVDF